MIYHIILLVEYTRQRHWRRRWNMLWVESDMMINKFGNLPPSPAATHSFFPSRVGSKMTNCFITFERHGTSVPSTTSMEICIWMPRMSGSSISSFFVQVKIFKINVCFVCLDFLRFILPWRTTSLPHCIWKWQLRTFIFLLLGKWVPIEWDGVVPFETS